MSPSNQILFRPLAQLTKWMHFPKDFTTWSTLNKGMHSAQKPKEMYTAHSKEHTGVAHSRKLGGAHSPQQKAHSSGDAIAHTAEELHKAHS